MATAVEFLHNLTGVRLFGGGSGEGDSMEGLRLVTVIGRSGSSICEGLLRVADESTE